MMVELELAKDAVGQVSRGIVRYGTPNGSFTRFKSDYPRNGLWSFCEIYWNLKMNLNI